MDDLCRHFQESWNSSDIPDELKEHGKSCQACQEFIKCQEALQAALPAWSVPEFTDDFELSVMGRIAEEGAKPPSLWDWLGKAFRVHLSIPVPVGAAACVALIASLFMNVHYWRQTGESEPPMGAVQIAAGDPTPIAGVLNANNAADMPTPQVVNFSHSQMTIPGEWLGSGMFLLVPIPPQDFYRADIQTNTTLTDRNSDI